MNTTTFLGDKPVNRMGFGAMQLAGPGVFGPPRDPVAARAVLRRAIELGIDHIDTSQYYGPDVVNDLIRQTHTVIALEEQLGAHEELRQAGKVDLIGLSNVDQAGSRTSTGPRRPRSLWRGCWLATSGCC